MIIDPNVETRAPGTHPVIATVADLGAVVRQARLNLSMTQQEFADLAGVGRRFVSDLELGKPTVELGKVIVVCRAAGIDLQAVRR